MALDFNGFMDQLHVKKAKFVGWSDGGDIALELALIHPEKIDKAVIMGANFLGESKGVALAIDTTWLNFPYLFLFLFEIWEQIIQGFQVIYWENHVG